MEPNNMPSSNYQPTQPPSFQSAPVSTPAKKVGPIVTVLIIVLVLIIAALYIFASRTSEPTTPNDDAAGNMTTDNATKEVQPVTSTASDPSSLQADLDASASGLDGQNF